MDNRLATLALPHFVDRVKVENIGQPVTGKKIFLLFVVALNWWIANCHPVPERHCFVVKKTEPRCAKSRRGPDSW